MLKNESAQNATKPIPLRRLVFLIPVVYLLCQTGSVWRRYRILSEKSNRQKKLLTVQSVQLCMDADVACPYADVEGLYR
jgi:hypothetical protein